MKAVVTGSSEGHVDRRHHDDDDDDDDDYDDGEYFSKMSRKRPRILAPVWPRRSFHLIGFL